MTQWSFWARSRVEGDGKPPTSLDDSLAVVLGKVDGGGRWKATNESKRLVGGLFGRGRGRRDVNGGRRRH